MTGSDRYRSVEPSTPDRPRITGDPGHTGRHRLGDWQDTGLLPAQPGPARPDDGDDGASTALSSYVVSHLRTLVPAIWGALITWAIDRWVPWVPVEVATDPTVLAFVTSTVTVVWYALWRAVEPRVPAVVAAFALGHPAEPAYPD